MLFVGWLFLCGLFGLAWTLMTCLVTLFVVVVYFGCNTLGLLLTLDLIVAIDWL